MDEQELGKKLKQARQSAGRNLAGIAKELKIEREQLVEFESGQFELEQLGPHQRGYLKSYVLLLNLEWSNYIQPERVKTKTELKLPQYQRLKSWVLSQKIRKSGLALVVIVGLSGTIWTVSQLFLAPELSINHPIEAEIAQSSRQIRVSGKTSPGSDVVINDVPVAVGLKGEFNENVFLARGVNRVQVKAINSLSRQAEREFVVVVATPGDNQ